MFKKNDQPRSEFHDIHHERIVASYEAALASDVTFPVAMLIDPEDETGDRILAELADCIPTPESPAGEIDEEQRGVVFVLPYDEAIHRLETVCDNCVKFLEQTRTVKSQIDKADRLMMYMVVSFGMVDCKLEPRSAKS